MRNYDFAPPTERDISNRDKEIERLDAKIAELQGRRCETCKHWGTYAREEGTFKLKSCFAIPQIESVFDKKHAATKAFTQDGNGWYSAFWTLPDFGCVMHEAKGDEA